VPTPNVSCIDLVVDLERAASPEAINDALRSAAQGKLAGIVAVTDKKLVSADFRQDPHSAVVASDQTRVQGSMARVLAWYDNEWAFARRMIDTARVMSGAPSP
jgi:glyceraldehyde 3-phosphate dehydrogenase